MLADDDCDDPFLRKTSTLFIAFGGRVSLNERARRKRAAGAATEGAKGEESDFAASSAFFYTGDKRPRWLATYSMSPMAISRRRLTLARTLSSSLLGESSV